MDELRALRRQRFLTQKELAARVGVSYQTVQTWEGGTATPRLRYIPKLAEALGLDPAALLEMLERPGKAKAA